MKKKFNQSLQCSSRTATSYGRPWEGGGGWFVPVQINVSHLPPGLAVVSPDGRNQKVNNIVCPV